MVTFIGSRPKRLWQIKVRVVVAMGTWAQTGIITSFRQRR